MEDMFNRIAKAICPEVFLDNPNFDNSEHRMSMHEYYSNDVVDIPCEDITEEE